VTISRAIEIPLVPTSKNVWQRCHWAKRGSIKKAWHEEVWAGVNIRPRLPRPVGSVTCSMHVFWDKPGVLPDHHNLDMVHECVADGLVEAGILTDDAGGVYHRGSFGIERVKKGQGRTVIRLDLE